MSWSYITTLRTDAGAEHRLPTILKQYFKGKHDITLPEDFGPCGNVTLPKSGNRLNLFGSQSDEESAEDLGTLIVIEDLALPRSHTDFYIYGDVKRMCKQCGGFETNDFNYCPKCGSKLTHELW